MRVQWYSHQMRMNQLIVNASIILLSCLLSALFTIWMTRKNNKIASEVVTTGFEDIIKEVQGLLDTEFEQFRPLISRAMSIAGSAGAQVKKTQAFEKQLIETIQDDLPITPGMVRAFSPALGDMVDENPRLLVTAANVMQKLLGGGGLLDTGSASRDPIDRRPEV